MNDPGFADTSLRAGSSVVADSLGRSAASLDGFGVDIERTLAWTAEAARAIVDEPSVFERWSALATVASVDVAGARTLEPHVDALTMLAEAAAVTDIDQLLSELEATRDATWGVFAAERAGTRVEAREVDGRWQLSGTKPWCSLAAHLSHALVTAWTSPTERGLFAVNLRGRGVRPEQGPWVSRGLAQIVSAPVEFDGAAAIPIGTAGWYLRRPGFAWGGIGVAAVWWGATAPLVRRVLDAARREKADQLAAVYAGEADAAQWSARAVLADAAARADAASAVAVPGSATGPGLDPSPSVIAHRVRAVVAASSERVTALAERALGPGPLTTDEAYARRIADLRIYARQHHGERDLARLGEKLASV